MKKIKDVLLAYVPEVPLGGAGSKPDIDRKRMEAELRAVVKRNQVYFNIAAGMAIVLFAGLLAAVMTHLDKPEWIRGFSIATGVSFVGVIQLTTNLWKAKVASDTVVALAGSLPETALKTAMAALIKKM